jgi:endonuclease/exonuclease/phosphatase family metal-dependent hydrolase
MRIITFTVFILSLFLFFSVNLSPEAFSYTGLLPLLIPFFMVINVLLFLILIIAKRKILVIPLLALLIGWKFIGVTLQWNEVPAEAEGLAILSYNTLFFNYWQSQEDGQDLTKNSLQWVRDNPSDVKCLQEFLQDYTTPSLNALKQLSDNGNYGYSYHIIDGHPDRRSFGLAIFSKHPIINKGLVFDNQRNNGAMFVDITVDADTIRIYNTHLESMNIKTSNLGNVEGIKKNYWTTLRKLKNGIEMRAEQVRILSEHIKNCPYPVILAGDFNDVPYSYTYFTLKSILLNAFEEAGRGFGFTYNKVLFFLRIDNIFYDKAFEIQRFKTHREVDYSDHYPISAVFSLKKKPFQEDSRN